MTTWNFAPGAALVTGAASGIGRATAAALVAAGLPVLLLDRDEAGLAALAAELGDSARAAAADISDEESVAGTVGELADGVQLAYVAHCAGIHQSAGTAELTGGDWSHMLAVNLVGAFNVARACLPWLRSAPYPAMVNVTSIEAHRVVALVNPHPTPHYAAAKGGLDMLSRCLAVEFAPYGIRVNAVAPGPVATPMIAADHHGASELASPFADHLLIKRYAQPGEIADAICFLLSRSASYITATTLMVDGGYTAL